ncbi:AtpZ/AtpI family protein [Alkalicoccus daliensis]|uniref:Putative F0F1-ATPase subunit Ca2+/Mg2+ transporter n=1 Tax=Alkalicoccus daliensis TaxID=745820 RepID=A0A1H0GLG2_9BACI|nr:AtpZ/AtpI family protein [Alkalicoccus daliensis]SDO07816.1 Putative F0F1-ATPase subunit Ca2+/Mg2+ transporter [Alkalicoccus daliensis]
MPNEPKRSPYRSVLKAFALMSTISSYIIGAILLGVFGGRWLDQYFGTNSVFLVITLLAGLGTAMYGIYSAVKKFTEDENDNDV